jgi:hypothetical protein
LSDRRVMKSILLIIVLVELCCSEQDAGNRTRNIILPTISTIIILLLIGMICWKRFFVPNRVIMPYNNPQLAFITQTAHAPRMTYQTVWPPPMAMESQPPSYYSVVNSASMAPNLLHVKQ